MNSCVEMSIVSVVTIVVDGAHRATSYVSPNLTVKATRLFKKRPRERQSDIRLTIGKPNFRERAFIKDCVRAGEPFPVKKLTIEPFGAGAQ